MRSFFESLKQNKMLQNDKKKLPQKSLESIFLTTEFCFLGTRDHLTVVGQ